MDSGGGKKIKCPCCKICQECTGFQNILKPQDSVYKLKWIDRDNNDKFEDDIIMQNTKDVKISSTELALAFDQHQLNCAKCQQVMKHAQSLLQNVPSISKKDIINVCGHCRKKFESLVPCLECEKIVKKFMATTGKVDKYKDDKKKHVLMFLKFQNFLKKLASDDVQSKKGKSRPSSAISIETPLFRPEFLRPSTGITLPADSVVSGQYYKQKWFPDTNEQRTRKRTGDSHSIKIQVTEHYFYRSMSDESLLQTGIIPEPMKTHSLQNITEKPIKPCLLSHYDKEKEMRKKEPKEKYGKEYVQEDSFIATLASDAIRQMLSKDFQYIFPKDIKKPKETPNINVASAELIKDTQDRLKLEADKIKKKQEELEFAREEKKRLAVEEYSLLYEEQIKQLNEEEEERKKIAEEEKRKDVGGEKGDMTEYDSKKLSDGSKKALSDKKFDSESKRDIIKKTPVSSTSKTTDIALGESKEGKSKTFDEDKRDKDGKMSRYTDKKQREEGKPKGDKHEKTGRKERKLYEDKYEKQRNIEKYGKEKGDKQRDQDGKQEKGEKQRDIDGKSKKYGKEKGEKRRDQGGKQEKGEKQRDIDGKLEKFGKGKGDKQRDQDGKHEKGEKQRDMDGKLEKYGKGKGDKQKDHDVRQAKGEKQRDMDGKSEKYGKEKGDKQKDQNGKQEKGEKQRDKDGKLEKYGKEKEDKQKDQDGKQEKDEKQRDMDVKSSKEKDGKQTGKEDTSAQGRDGKQRDMEGKNDEQKGGTEGVGKGKEDKYFQGRDEKQRGRDDNYSSQSKDKKQKDDIGKLTKDKDDKQEQRQKDGKTITEKGDKKEEKQDEISKEMSAKQRDKDKKLKDKGAMPPKGKDETSKDQDSESKSAAIKEQEQQKETKINESLANSLLAKQAKAKDDEAKMQKAQDDIARKAREAAEKAALHLGDKMAAGGKGMQGPLGHSKIPGFAPHDDAHHTKHEKLANRDVNGKELNIKQTVVKEPSHNELALRLIKTKQSKKKKGAPKSITKTDIELYKRLLSMGKGTANFFDTSDMELDILSLQRKDEEVDDIIIGEKIYGKKRVKAKPDDEKISAMLFKSVFIAEPLQPPAPAAVASEPILPSVTSKQTKPMEAEAKGVIRYALSDRTFIDKGWTLLPTEKVVRKMNVYRMRPVHPEFDWFERNKNKRLMLYDTGERLAEFDDDGRGRWYYRNGRLALDYYDSEEAHAQQRFVIYSSGEPDERGRARPITVLGTFDYLGNGVVFDHAGKIRLKYNQTEGVILDRALGPVSHWKWHSLNDPPVLQQVMIDTQLARKDPEILQLADVPVEEKGCPDNEEMLSIEFDNFIKEKSKKLSQKFKPFQIRMKALKINEQFSLKVLDQASIYLTFRDGTTNMKLNLGMLLDHQEIVDTDTADMGEVSNNIERLPARSDSITGLQRSITHAQRVERMRMEREHRLRRPIPCSSVDQLAAGASQPMRRPLIAAPSDSSTTAGENRCRCRKPSSSNLYYDTRLT